MMDFLRGGNGNFQRPLHHTSEVILTQNAIDELFSVIARNQLQACPGCSTGGAESKYFGTWEVCQDHIID